MKRRFQLIVAMLTLAACDPNPGKPGEEPKIGELASPRIAGRLFTCDLTYFAYTGPILSESRALVKMGIDTSPVTGGWKVVETTVTTPLADAGGFDPWLQFVASPQRAFVRQDGPVMILAVANGAPITFNAISGALDWRVQGTLGDAGYRGGCY